jgi:hypothetical protein
MQKPPIKDPKVAAYVQFLEEKLYAIEEVDKVTVYVTLRSQLHDLCEQLKIGEEIEVEDGKDAEGKPVMKKMRLGRIDFFGDKDNKTTERFQKIAPLLFELEKLLAQKRKEMTETQRDRADEEYRKSTGIAEKFAQ